MNVTSLSSLAGKNIDSTFWLFESKVKEGIFRFGNITLLRLFFRVAERRKICIKSISKRYFLANTFVRNVLQQM